MKKYSRREIGNLFVCFLVLVVLVACNGKSSLSYLSEQPLPQSSSDAEEVKKSETMTDHRDGQIYRTVKIGNQTWMAQNLNYETAESFCYDDHMSSCLKYGRLYTWTAATNVCPAGWHLPTLAEWDELIDSLGGMPSAALALKSKTGWKSKSSSHDAKGTDSLGFSVLSSGMRNDDGTYDALFEYSAFWTSSDLISFIAHVVQFGDLSLKNHISEVLKKNGYSVRCLKDDAERDSVHRQLQNEKWESMKDSRDGETYRIVKIGEQTWTAENMRYKTADSDCFGNDTNECHRYGRYYTWKAAQNVCPAGFHLPTLSEWNVLIKEVGGFAVAGKNLKLGAGWLNDGYGTDDFVFSALAGGYMKKNENLFEGDYALFWSAPEENSDVAHFMGLQRNDIAYTSDESKNSKLSVRCVKDE